MIRSFAYLGPAGTYSDLALRRFIKPQRTLPCFSIAEIFRLVHAGEVDAGFVPIENVIEGPVTETLDLLLEYRSQLLIESSHLMPIEHALGAPRADVGLDQISQILSHEQPLRQCSEFLRKRCPQAVLTPTESTAAAARQVSLDMDAASTPGAMRVRAAIGARETLEELGLSIVAENIADVTENRTRFVVIRRGAAEELFNAAPEERPGFVTSVAVIPGRDRQGLLFEILNVISVQNGINLLSIHSRPDARGGFVFFMELEGWLGDEKVRRCFSDLQDYCRHATAETAAIAVFGSYNREPFHKQTLSKILLIGANGEMGRCLAPIFETMGFSVTRHDRDTKHALHDLAAEADVLFFSIPMSSFPTVTEEILPHLRPGQLLVENCSVKHAGLPVLLEKSPPDVEILGVHTMFGGDLKSLKDQNIIITRTERSGAKADAFEAALYKHGAKLTYAGAAEHDRVTAYVQSLLHFNAVAMAEVLRTEFAEASQIEPFSTPNYRALLHVMQRVTAQSSPLLKDIQSLNPEATFMRHRFLQSAVRLAFAMDHGEFDELAKSAEQSKAFFRQK